MQSYIIIAWKLYPISNRTYGALSQHLMTMTQWKLIMTVILMSHNEIIISVYNGTVSCGNPFCTSSLFSVITKFTNHHLKV